MSTLASYLPQAVGASLDQIFMVTGRVDFSKNLAGPQHRSGGLGAVADSQKR